MNQNRKYREQRRIYTRKQDRGKNEKKRRANKLTHIDLGK